LKARGDILDVRAFLQRCVGLETPRRTWLPILERTLGPEMGHLVAILTAIDEEEINPDHTGAIRSGLGQINPKIRIAQNSR
jgi:hypothetical protein